ncbi:nmrA-like family protein [Phyllosticta citribraziliensis]|uniref:NmrA-like family protein n=1 Tax=Phyllosticta citribraziliensis TaxID=989973 RepID=A0ABR1M8N9_9PEZI
MVTTVGIAGASGKLGRLVAAALLRLPSPPTLRLYVRDASKLPSWLSSSPHTVITGGADDRAATVEFARGCNVVICTYLGPDALMEEGQKVLIDACAEAGVPRYVASDYTVDYRPLKDGELFPKDPMRHVMAYCNDKAGVEGVHVMIGAFMDTWWSGFFGAWVPDESGKGGKLRYWGSGDEAWEVSSYENTAEWIARVAVDGEAKGVEKFLGDRKNIHQIAAAMSSVYSFTPSLEPLGSLADLHATMHQKRDSEPENYYAYLPMWYQYYMLNGSTLLVPPGSSAEKELSNNRYPDVKAVTFEDYLRMYSPKELSGAMMGIGEKAGK